MTVEPGTTGSPRGGAGRTGGILKNDRSYLLRDKNAQQQPNKAKGDNNSLGDMKAVADAVDEIEYVDEVVEDDPSYGGSPGGGGGVHRQQQHHHHHRPASPRSPRSPRSPFRRSNSLGSGLRSAGGEEIVEYVIDDSEDEEVVEEIEEEVIEETEVEYYEEEEEVDVGDEYEEVLIEDDKQGGGGGVSFGDVEEEIIETEHPDEDPHHLEGDATDGGDDAGGDAGTGEEEEEEPEDLPDRDDVIEAISYIMAQEQVIKYGLVTQEQSDEMEALPLPDLMEIMNHFEACDNNNATIRWDLVLALINPKYAADFEDEPSDDEDEDEDADKVADLVTPSMLRSASAGGGCPADYDEVGSASAGAVDDGIFSIHSDGNANANNASDPLCNASVGSGYSLDASKVDCDSSMSDVGCDEDTAHDDDVVDAKNLDPRIRAMYTKSMVELEKKKSFD